MSTIINLIDENTLIQRINQLAEQISKDYEGRELVVICVLKGAFYFYADLTRRLNLDTKLEFMRVSSYEGENSTGKVDVKLDIDGSIEEKDVLVVDDIIDSGISMAFIYDYLSLKKPRSIKTCVLLDKPERRENDMKADYTGFIIPNRFVVGYGLDLDERYRNYPEVNCVINEDEDIEKVKQDKELIKRKLKKSLN